MFGLLLFLSVVLAQDPTPPAGLPGKFFSWMVVSVTMPGTPKPIFSQGQMIALDLARNFAVRYNEQNLINSTLERPTDYCDGATKMKYRVEDGTGLRSKNPPCNESMPLKAPLASPGYPKDFLDTAQFMGVVKVNQKECNHFYSSQVSVDNVPFQMDLFTTEHEGYPCQISLQNKDTSAIYTWAFDGFNDIIPGGIPLDVAKLLCAERDWTCQANPKATPQSLQTALGWVCGVQDCSPINPGGSHFIPNTLVDHCNWAFNTYYLSTRFMQGGSACSFSGNAILAPPKTFKPAKDISPEHPVLTFQADPLPFPLLMIC